VFISSIAPVDTLSAQSASAASDSVVVKALHDEIYRNLNQLKSDVAGKPCYISYMLLRGTDAEASGYLGALVGSNTNSLNDYYLRLLMGSFQTTDENFNDPYAQRSSRATTSVSTPLDDNYWGIRRAFWWNTDNVFRSASQTYSNKLKVLKDKTLPDEYKDLPDYTPAVPLKADFTHGEVYKPNLEQLESLARDVSSVFRTRPQVINSGVTVSAVNAIAYLVTTEGMEIKIPLNLAVVTISASVYSNDGEPIGDRLVYVARFTNQLPAADTMKQHAQLLADYLVKLKDAKVETEAYSGPVMLYQQVVASAFGATLFGGSTALVANREPLVNGFSKKLTVQSSGSIELKLGKRIVSKDISVVLKPHIRYFQKVGLLGSYDVDGEGVVPPDELVLVNNGVLKNLMSNRVPTPKVRTSNGHHRIYLNGIGSSFTDGPGVAFITTDAPKSQEEMMQLLKEEMETKGLDHAYVIRPLIDGCSFSPFCYYRFDLATGKETLVRSIEASDITLSSMNKILGCGDGQFLSSYLLNSYGMETNNASGLPVSIIAPDCMLLQELTLEPHSSSFNTDGPLLDNPVGGDDGE
jgi:Predicted Zn-dependent proteases and their inactivated homologs